MPIKGVHAMFYSEQADAVRAFVRDKLQVPATDVGDGWQIFDLAEANLGVHPTDHPGAPASGTHDVSFYTDDLEATIAELRGRGVEFDDDVSDQGYATAIHFTMPGAVRCELYQPKFKTAPRQHSIDYIEIGVTDIAAAKVFYGAAFGWRFTDYGSDYVGIQSPFPGKEVGGLRKDDEVKAGGPLVVLFSDDLEASVAAVENAGGTITTPPFAFPGGRRFHFADPSGNELGVWSPA